MRLRTLLLLFVAIGLAGGTAVLARSWLAAQRAAEIAEASPLALPTPAKSVLVARNGQEALRAARLGAPDVVTMDLTMPGMDGLACIPELLALHPQARILVISALTGGTMRFSQLRAQVEGITQKMLTQTLRGLERDGLVERRVYPVVPPHVEYTLTALGSGLSDTIAGIRAWAYQHMDEIEAARATFDTRAS